MKTMRAIFDYFPGRKPQKESRGPGASAILSGNSEGWAIVNSNRNEKYEEWTFVTREEHTCKDTESFSDYIYLKGELSYLVHEDSGGQKKTSDNSQDIEQIREKILIETNKAEGILKWLLAKPFPPINDLLSAWSTFAEIEGRIIAIFRDEKEMVWVPSVRSAAVESWSVFCRFNKKYGSRLAEFPFHLPNTGRGLVSEFQQKFPV